MRMESSISEGSGVGAVGDEAGGGDLFEEGSGGLIEVELECGGEGDPEEFLGLVIEGHLAGGCGGDVVEEEEVGGAEEFGGIDGLLGEDELEVGDIEVGLLFGFADEGLGGGFSAFDFTAWDAPFVPPFVGADEEDVGGGGVEDEGADGGDGEVGGCWGFGLEGAAKCLEVGGGEVRFCFEEFFWRVVSGEYGDRKDACVLGGLDIVDHIADVGGVFGCEVVLLENRADDEDFVHGPGVSFVEEIANAEAGGLGLEVVVGDAGESEDLAPGAVAGFEEFEGSREKSDGLLFGEELDVAGLDFGDGNVGEDLGVKIGVGEAELGAECFRREGGAAVVGEDAVDGAEDGEAVVDEGAGPVEDDGFHGPGDFGSGDGRVGGRGRGAAGDQPTRKRISRMALLPKRDWRRVRRVRFMAERVWWTAGWMTLTVRMRWRMSAGREWSATKSPTRERHCARTSSSRRRPSTPALLMMEPTRSAASCSSLRPGRGSERPRHSEMRRVRAVGLREGWRGGRFV